MFFDNLQGAALVCLLVVGPTVACGGRESARDEAAAADSTAAEAANAAAPAASTPSTDPNADATSAPLAVADIDRWEQGIAGELEAVKAGGAKLKTAKSGEDTLSAMMGVQEMNTLSAGAQAAGVDQERYKVIRSNLSAATSYLAPGLGGIDTAMLLPAQRSELKQMNEAQLKQLEGTVPAAVVEALRPRAAELRQKDLELVGTRLKSAGM